MNPVNWVFSRASRMLRAATHLVRMQCVCQSVCVWTFFFPPTPIS